MINYNLDKFFGLTIPKTEQEVINYSGDFKVGYKTGNHHVFGILKLEKSKVQQKGEQSPYGSEPKTSKLF
jgi:hypothetical protein